MAIEDVNKPKVEGKTAPPIGRSEQQPTMVDEMLKIRQYRDAKDLIDKTMGDGPPKAEVESMGASVVKAALDNSQKAAEAAQAMADRKDVVAEKARKEADDSRQAFYTILFQQMSDVSRNLQSAFDDVKRGAEPKSATSIIKEAKELLEVIAPQKPEGERVQATAPVDMTSQITLKKMELDHSLAMKQLELTIAEMNNNFNLKLADFKDNKERSWRKYEDDKSFRSEGLGALQDIGMAISGGIKKDMPGSRVATKTAEAKSGTKVSREEEYAVEVNAFPCQQCGEQIAVPEEGGIVTCTQCGSEYTVRKK